MDNTPQLIVRDCCRTCINGLDQDTITYPHDTCKCGIIRAVLPGMPEIKLECPYHKTRQTNIRIFTMELEPHTPEDPQRMCEECALQSGPCCLDRSYCEFPKTGKTWKKHLPDA